jgi:hypothetical protein
LKVIILFLSILLAACASDIIQNGSTAAIEVKPVTGRLLYPYEPSVQCKGCHSDQFYEFDESMHAKAFSNQLFNAQYFNDVVPRAQRDPEMVPEARKCIACHAPVVFMNYTGLVTTPAQANKYETGVTCDFCHTLAGYADNGDFMQTASGKKLGPFPSDGGSTHHSEYSRFIAVGDFCGRCHNATNHVGLEVKSTYYEWRESKFGSRGVACQECHMNKNGFLEDGKATYDRGQAAHIKIGNVTKKLKDHDKLYNHAFPGAHSSTQLLDALNLEFKVNTLTVESGGRFPFALTVNSERSGHKMPSGSSDLRFMWLVVTASTEDGTTFPVFINNPRIKKGSDYSIAGGSRDDAIILRNDVPVGSRLYRTVLVNATGRQSLFQYDAVRSAFDNRLSAGEVRKEGYYFKLPEQFSGKVTLEANLYYKGAPSSFSKRMQVPESEVVLVATQKRTITVETSNAPNK